MERWEELLSGAATSPLSHTVCVPRQAVLTAREGEYGPPTSWQIYPSTPSFMGGEGSGQMTLAFIHGSAHKPKTLHSLLHFYLIPCNSCGGGVVPWVCRAIACPDFWRVLPPFHARSWLSIIQFLGSWLFNMCQTQSKCRIGFSALSLMWQQSLACNCASPLFRSQLPWVDSFLHPGTTANSIKTKNTYKYGGASKSIQPFPTTHLDVFCETWIFKVWLPLQGCLCFASRPVQWFTLYSICHW